MNRSIKHIHTAVSAPIDNLSTFRPLPTRMLEHLDPFLFLNHHGPQHFSPNNRGLPFGPHPHRGFETLTYILKGDIVHWDSNGHKSRINAGGAQWMTAGSGLIHSEVSSEEFMEKGGDEEVIQLWLNLSARHKMTEPAYHGLHQEDITHFHLDDGRVKVHLISGEWAGYRGPVNSLENLTMSGVEMQEGTSITLEVPEENQILFYVVHGELTVNGRNVKTHQLIEFDFRGQSLDIECHEAAYLIFGHGKPLNEPIVAQGPFVVNSYKELMQAFEDYQSGKMGHWNL